MTTFSAMTGYNLEVRRRILYKRLGLAAVLALVGLFGLYGMFQYGEIGFRVGYAQGKKDIDWKAKLVEDQEYTTKACTTWWFGMETSERKIVKPKIR